jgi:hypothetical protein
MADMDEMETDLPQTAEAVAEHERQIRQQLETKRVERSVPVPTGDRDVRRMLRELKEPITLFGEEVPFLNAKVLRFEFVLIWW